MQVYTSDLFQLDIIKAFWLWDVCIKLVQFGSFLSFSIFIDRKQYGRRTNQFSGTVKFCIKLKKRQI